MSQEIKLDGQVILVNEFNNIIKINIDSPFQDPSYRMPEWDFQCSGFGINNKIIKLILEKKFRLFIHEAESNKDFLIDYFEIMDLLDKYNLDYTVRETKLKILPKKFFREL